MNRPWPSLLLAAALGSLLLTARAQRLDLDKDIELEITGEVVQNSLLTYLSPFFGKSTGTDPTQRAPLIVDLTFDKVMVANKEGSDYGITCSPESLCEISGEKTFCKYQNISIYDCQQGSVLTRYRDSKVNDNNLPQLTTFFYNSTLSWDSKFGNRGVFGLSPSSPVWNYFETAYNKQPGQDSIETSLSYRVKDPKNSIDQTRTQLYDSFFTVNGRTGINDPVVKRFDASKFTQWVYEGATVVYSRNNTKTTNICVDNTQNAYFLSTDAANITRSIFTKLCGNPSGCTRSNSDFSKVENLQIKFEASDSKKFTMDVKPEEYLNYDADDSVLIAIQDLSSSSCSNAGPKVTEAVGRLMLTKVEFVVRINGKDNFDIGFNEITYPKDTLFLIILIALGVVILLIIVGIVVASTFSKKRTAEADNADYHKQTGDDN